MKYKITEHVLQIPWSSLLAISDKNIGVRFPYELSYIGKKDWVLVKKNYDNFGVCFVKTDANFSRKLNFYFNCTESLTLFQMKYL